MRGLRCTGAVLALAAALVSQSPRVEVSGPTPPVVRLGGTAVVELRFQGQGAQPSLGELPRVDGLRLEFGGVSRQFSFDGRQSTYTVTVPLQIRPERVGVFEVPAFEVGTAAGVERVGPFRVECVRDDLATKYAFLDVSIEPRRVYVNQPIDVRIAFGVDERVPVATTTVATPSGFVDVPLIQLQIPWLDDVEGTVKVGSAQADQPPRSLPAVVNGVAQNVPGETGLQRNEQTWRRYVLDRRLLPTRPGELEVGAQELQVSVTSGRRRFGMFMEPLQRDTEQLSLRGDAIRIEVLPLPDAGRPASYTGAVGSFTLSASVDRSALRVGDTLRLTLRVAGRGNVEFLELPHVDDVPGYHVLGRSENRSADSATLTIDLTPLSVGAGPLPAVSWSWFDPTPGVERYLETATAPIPIAVSPLPEGAGLSAPDERPTGALVAGVDDIHDIVPAAELAAAPAAQVVRRSRAVDALALLGPWLAAVLGLWWWRAYRARRRDVIGRRARGALRALRSALDGGAAPDVALAEYLASKLGCPAAAVLTPDLGERLGRAGCDGSLAARAQVLLEAGTAARYGGGTAPTAAAVDELAAELEAQPFLAQRRSYPAGAALTGLLLTCTLLGAQTQPASSRAEAAYREGDYETAAERWRTALQQPDADPRLYYNLGNALYRCGHEAEALWAWSMARPAMPRDERLLANIALVERRLGVSSTGSGADQPFHTALRELHDALTHAELFWLCAAGNLLAAVLVLAGRGAVRVLGGLVAIPALLLALELLVLGPLRLPAAIVTAPDAPVRAEPTDGLDPIAHLRPGARVDIAGRGPEWTRVRLPQREGWVRTGALAFLRDR
ncbi:MAG: BatD family protein [Planctomycetes bacterium]|nr:BatD family protein [Planctomycetota bacterium]